MTDSRIREQARSYKGSSKPQIVGAAICTGTCRCRVAQGLCESDLGREFFRAQILPPHPQNVHQQHAEKKQQRDSAEQQAHKIRFTFFVAPGETVIRNDSGDTEKYEIQHGSTKVS